MNTKLLTTVTILALTSCAGGKQAKQRRIFVGGMGEVLCSEVSREKLSGCTAPDGQSFEILFPANVVEISKLRGDSDE